MTIIIRIIINYNISINGNGFDFGTLRNQNTMVWQQLSEGSDYSNTDIYYKLRVDQVWTIRLRHYVIQTMCMLYGRVVVVTEMPTLGCWHFRRAHKHNNNIVLETRPTTTTTETAVFWFLVREGCTFDCFCDLWL